MTLTRLVVNDLVANRSIWVGALVVSAAAAAALSVAAALIDTSLGLDLTVAAALAVLASAAVVLTVVATVVVLSSVTQLTVALQRRSYALWQLVGVPAQSVTAVVRVQLAVVALVGAAVGTAVAGPFVPAFLRFGLSEATGLRHLDERFRPVTAAVVVAVVTTVVVLSGLGASRRAGRVRAVEVLRDPAQGRGRMTWGRWAVAAASLSIAVALTWTLGSGGVRGGSQVLLIGPLSTATAAAVGPAWFPAVLRMWTSLLPAHLSASWFLARNAAAHQATRSTATISALVVTIALPGSLYAGFSTFGHAAAAATGHEPGSLAPSTFLLLLGGALTVSLSGGAATVLMATQTREQESALVQAAGGTRATVLARALWESLVLVGTAALVAAVVLIWTGCSAALSLSRATPTAPGFGAGPAAAATAVCTLVLVTVSVLPVLAALRRPVRAVLADGV